MYIYNIYSVSINPPKNSINVVDVDFSSIYLIKLDKI
jgi:hypothetical protein